MTSNNESTTSNIDENTTIKFRMITANARSLPSKIDSLVDYFDELDLHAAALTETWLTDRREHTEGENDIAERENIRLIKKNRRTRGGGVAIAFDNRKLSLKEHKISDNRYELVCGTGKVLSNNQPVIIISYYIPPKQKSSTTDDMMTCISDGLSLLLVKFSDPLIFIAGDANCRDMSLAFADLPGIIEVPSPPTRGENRLDLIHCNYTDEPATALCPLENEEGSRSDHKVLFLEGEIRMVHHFTKTRIMRRRMRPDDIASFNTLCINTQWEKIGTGNPIHTANAMHTLLERHVDMCFPLRAIVIKSTDKPWMNNFIRRAVRRRKKIFKKEYRSNRWRRHKKKIVRLIQERKTEYMDGIKQSVKEAGNTRAYHQAIKKLQTKDTPSQKPWCLQNMFPGMPEEEIAEMSADYFNAISHEFTPIAAPPPPENPRQLLSVHEVSARLKKIRKPKSQVKGDLNPNLIGPLVDVLAIPLTIIFNEVFLTNIWPETWKHETVHLIPKKPSPSSLSELRNLSCTPLFSKLLETFLLEDLKSETHLSENQYGGRKGVSTDHFLIDMWNNILEPLDDARASVNVLSIDFEKAFNRLDHRACINALEKKGASKRSTNLVNAFLYGRTMSIKVSQDVSSTKRTVPGGSPQGSILANYLFCATTDDLDNDETNETISFEANGENFTDSNSSEGGPNSMLPRLPAPLAPIGTSTPTARGQFVRFKPPGNLGRNLESSYSSSSDSDSTRPFVRFNRPFVLQTSSEESDVEEEVAMRDEYIGPVPRWTEEEIKIQKYIDDFSAVEKIANSKCRTIFSTDRPCLLGWAIKSAGLFGQMSGRSEAKGMRINANKTQMLCVTASSYDVVFRMRTSSQILTSSNTGTLRILGFNFGPKPNVSYQVTYMIGKFRGRIWSLYHLKRGGMSRDDITFVYKSVILPILDYACVTYHSMLTAAQNDLLERLQRRAVKIIHGKYASYSATLEKMGLVPLKERRQKLVEKFAEKNRNKRGWFQPENSVRPQRLGERVQEKFARTERLRNSPLYYMRRLLNQNAARRVEPN